MMNNVSIYGVQGVDPMGIQDGLMSMLFESGEGFAAAMDSALLSPELDNGLNTSESEGGDLLSSFGEGESSDGLQLLQSELGGAIMPGFNLGAESSGLNKMMPTTGMMSGTMGSNVAQPMETSSDQGGDLDLSSLDLSALEANGLTPSEGMDAAMAAEQMTSQVTASTPPVASQAAASTQAASSKEFSGARKISSKGAVSETKADELGVDEAQSTREVSMTGREQTGIEGGDEVPEEWDSTHLQLDGEFDPIAANTPFGREFQSVTVDARVAVQGDNPDAVDTDAVKETTKSDEKKSVQAVNEAQVDVEEFEENPADARVELSDQRTVRVVVDEDLAVEVSQDGEAVDVLVEGAPDVAQEMRDAAPEIAESLNESGMHLRDFSTRQDGQSPNEAPTQQRGDGVEVNTENVVETAKVNRGNSVNIVA
jgi:hypothetical protein